MNNKISSIQHGMLLALISCGLYLGLGNVILIRKGGSEVLISMLIGVIIGLIPIIMYIKISNTYPDLNIYEKNKKIFGKTGGKIINVLLILIYITMLVLSLRSMVVFLTSKYFMNSPFYFIGCLILATVIIICFKGLETIARISQVTFFMSIALVVLIETIVLKYVDIGNILPMFTSDGYMNNIISGAVYYAASCSLLCMLLLSISKKNIKNSKNFERNVIIFYLFASLSLTVVMFFVVSSFGYKLASLFRYPEYIILKKVNISSTDLHLENLLAFRWVFYMLALANVSLYGLMEGVKSFSKNIKLNKIIVVVIAILCLPIAKMTFGNVPHSILMIMKYYLPFIALPMFVVLLLIFTRCLFIKKKDNS